MANYNDNIRKDINGRSLVNENKWNALKGEAKAKYVIEKLKEFGYYASMDAAYAVIGATGKKPVPVLIEGDAGVGKTSLAKATADMLGLPIIRAQFYGGIKINDLMFEYDTQKQILAVQAAQKSIDDLIDGLSVTDAMKTVANSVDFYGEEFLVQRPVLASITSPGHKILLLDEIDKCEESVEYMLLETLAEYTVTIPQIGTVSCAEEDLPYVFLTSNAYRDLSDAMKRRCLYLYLDAKTEDEIKDIIKQNLKCGEQYAITIAFMAYKLTTLYNLEHPVSISEIIQWSRFIMEHFGQVDIKKIKETMNASIPYLAKTGKDKQTIMWGLPEINEDELKTRF